MSCPVNKIDSNNTGLRYAEESCLRELPQATDPVTATGSITFGGAGTEGDTITVGGQTYTLVDAFIDDEDEIVIGSSAAETASRIAEAVLDGATAGSAAYIGAGTASNAQAAASAAGAVVAVTARTPGAAGNSIVLAASASNVTLSGATLAGGADESGAEAVWYALEPNSYSDFGGQITTVARNPINPSRQRKKGVTTDLDASGGFNQDLTFNNSTRLLQGFFFADIREKFSTSPMNGAKVAITGIGGTDTYQAAAGLDGFAVGDIVFASGFSAPNSGARVVTAATATTLTVTGGVNLVPETPSADAMLQVAGREFPAGAIGMEVQGGVVRMTSASIDMTTLGLIEGEWLYIGGQVSANRFDTSNGFARVGRITEEYLELDKVSWVPVDEDGSGVTLHVFFGSVLRNEPEQSLIKRRTFQLERTLGRDNDGIMSEYLVGAVPNELTLNIAQADKVNMDMAFVAVDNEQRNGQQGVKAGSRPTLLPTDAFNTSSDFSRIKLASVTGESAPAPLFAFATEMSLSINNNVSPNKAIGVLGAFDTSAGTFEVGGSMTAYFANVEAAQAVRNNADITLDVIMVKNNAGLLFDIPLLSLGDGRLTVEQDQAITIPLETNAAESVFGHTLLFQQFPYLPDAAM